jgi:hypothetical protein
MAKVTLTNHAITRLFEREIDTGDVKRIAKFGQVTKTESNGTITRVGLSSNGKQLIVKSKQEGVNIIIKTAYYGD